MITPQQREQARAQYQADGFYLCPGPILPSDVVQQAVAGMDAIRRGEYDRGAPPQPSPWNPGDDPNRLCKIEMPQMASQGIFQLVSHPAVGEWAAAVTGAQMVQVWWVQLLYKPTALAGNRGGTNIGWHQDRHYWGVWEDDSVLFTAWVALSDVTADAGPMIFARGSQRWGYRGDSDFFAQDQETQREGIAIPEGETWEEAAAILPPGGISFHDSLTYHGSGPNLRPEPRRSFAIHLRTEHSYPRNNAREGLVRFIDNLDCCPVIYGGSG